MGHDSATLFVELIAGLNTSAECPACKQEVPADGRCACGVESEPMAEERLRYVTDRLIRLARELVQGKAGFSEAYREVAEPPKIEKRGGARILAMPARRSA